MSAAGTGQGYMLTAAVEGVQRIRAANPDVPHHPDTRRRRNVVMQETSTDVQQVPRMIEATHGASAPARDHRRVLIAGVCVAATYVVSARLGFTVAFVAEQITTVWAPTGIAIAALLLWGRRLWPAVWLAAFVANAGTEAPLWIAMIIATGNTLEAVAAAWFLRRAGGSIRASVDSPIRPAI